MRFGYIMILIFSLFANATYLDPLLNLDPYAPQTTGFILSATMEYGISNAWYDNDGKKVETMSVDDPTLGMIETDFEYNGSDVWTNLAAGYCISPNFNAGLIFPLYGPSHTQKYTYSGVSTEYNQDNFAPSNPWIWGKGIIPLSGFDLMPRLGIKLPFLAYTRQEVLDDFDWLNPTAETKATTGDKSLSLDFAVGGRINNPNSTFQFSGNLGLRYNTEATYETTIALSYPYTEGIIYKEISTPGMSLSLRAKPGTSYGPERSMSSSLILEYATQLTETSTDVNSGGIDMGKTTEKGASILSVGLAQGFCPIPTQQLELGFIYDVAVKGATISSEDGTESTGYQPGGFAINITYYGNMGIQ